MSYFNTPISKVSTQIYFSKMSFVGNTSALDYLDFPVPIFNNISLTRNSDNLVIPTGHYLISAATGVNNSNLITNAINWSVEQDGVIVGNRGSSTQNNKVGTDSSFAAITVLTGTSIIKVQVTDQVGTTSIDTNTSSIQIQRVDL